MRVLFTLVGVWIWSIAAWAAEQQAQNCRILVLDIQEQIELEDFRQARKLLHDLVEKEAADCQTWHQLLAAELSLYEEDYSRARNLLEETLLTKAVLSNKQLYARASYLLALVFLDTGEEKEAINYLDQAIADTPALQATGWFYEALDTRIQLYTAEGKHEKAMVLLKKAVAEATKEGDAANQSYFLNQVATNYHASGKTDSAILYFHQLITHKKQQQDHAGLLSDYSTLGGLYQTLGEYEAAQVQLIEAAKAAELLKDTLSLITTYIDRANNYLYQRLLQPALIHAKRAEALSEQKNMLFSKGNSLAIQASVYELSQQKDTAVNTYKAALAIYERLELKQQSADIQVKIANLEANDENLNRAAEKLKVLLNTQIAAGDKLGELKARLSLAGILVKLNTNPQQVLELLNVSERIATETNNSSAAKSIFRLKSQTYAQASAYKNAFYSYQAFHRLEDSLMNQENAKMLRELEKLYETEKKDKAIAEQKAALEHQSRVLENRRNQITQLLLAMLAMALIIAFIIFINQRNQQLSRQRLAVLEKERETEVLRAMIAGEEKERQRIAKDLHDGLGAVMASAKMRVSALQYQMPELKDLEGFHKAESLLDDACNTVREVSHNMMPGALAQYGLEVAVEKMCKTIEIAHPIHVVLITHGLEYLEGEFIEINIYRIIQELLKNAVKHAAASEIIVQLTLEIEDNVLNVIVEDDGKGFEQTTIEEGIGLGSIRSRVLYLNGSLSIDSKRNEGSTFTINIPVHNSEASRESIPFVH